MKIFWILIILITFALTIIVVLNDPIDYDNCYDRCFARAEYESNWENKIKSNVFNDCIVEWDCAKEQNK